ncbi:helix-turn-helix domain-containing protein [Nonomuraea antimicrobica]
MSIDHEHQTHNTGGGLRRSRAVTVERASAVPRLATLGTLLRGWRERAMLTQEQLAERADLNVRTVRRLESSELQQPRATSIVLLAQALGLDGEERAMLAATARGLPGPGEGREPVTTGSPRAAISVPRQLPADVAAFVGRGRELTALERHEHPNTAAVTTIDGMAGVGKTALAVHAAHRLAPRFPDGQLFLNLHGHTGAVPVEPGDALARLLLALDVPDRRIPCDVEDRAALYRGVVADRRVLIVLDDASDADQVRPLLPAGPGCRLIVTGRRRLIGLDDTRALSLDVPPPAEAIALFTRMAGPERAGRRRRTS